MVFDFRVSVFLFIACLCVARRPHGCAQDQRAPHTEGGTGTVSWKRYRPGFFVSVGSALLPLPPARVVDTDMSKATAVPTTGARTNCRRGTTVHRNRNEKKFTRPG